MVDFKITGEAAQYDATIEVYAAWLQLYRVFRFSLMLNGQVIYTEPSA